MTTTLPNLDQPLPKPNARGLWDAARWYAALGLRVFPLEVGGKEPHKDLLGRGWRMREIASADPEQIDAWWGQVRFANIGIPQGPRTGTAVLDLDTKRGGDPYATLADRCRELGITLPAGPVCRTPSGGGHRWHLLPEDVPTVPKVQSWMRDVDFQAGGSYVVAPPSHLRPSVYRVSVRTAPGDPKPCAYEKDNGPWLGYFWERPDAPDAAPKGLVARLLGRGPLTAEQAWWPTQREFLTLLAGSELPSELLADTAAHGYRERAEAARVWGGGVPVEQWMETGIPLEQEKHNRCFFLVAASCTGRRMGVVETFQVLRQIADVTPLKDTSWPWDDDTLLDMAQRAFDGKPERDRQDAEEFHRVYGPAVRSLGRPS